MSVYGERISRLDEKVEALDERMARIEDKMDRLLSLKDKGMGVFWLIGIIFGTSAMTIGVETVKWFMGR